MTLRLLLALLSLVVAATGCMSTKTLPYASTLPPGSVTPTPAPAAVSVQLSAASPCLIGSTQTGFSIPDVIPQTLAALPLDANNNLILGAGAPAVTVTSGTPNALAVATSPAGANYFTLTGNPQNFTTTPVTLTVAIAKPAPSASPSAAPISLTVPVTLTQTLLAAGPTTVSAYAPASGTQCWTQTVASSAVAAADPVGNLYVANGANVTMYAPGTTKTVTTGPVTGTITALAADAKQNVYIGTPGIAYKFGNGGTVALLRYTPPFQSAVADIAVDANGNVFLSNGYPTTGNSIVEFPSGSTNSSRTLGGNLQVMGLLADKNGNLFELDGVAWVVNEYLPGATTPIFTTGTLPNQPYSFALDANGGLYVDAASTMFVYAAGATTPTSSFPTSFVLQHGIAVDRNGLIYVLDNGGTVSVYSSAGTLLSHIAGGAALQGGSIWIRP
ncbi:MAG: hypothetical protein JO101_08935 [Candidatus Eremiobacteraeota bacterium]|nr:hypothetical protein [Candidatus Eremiobacteraeota bacterium]